MTSTFRDLMNKKHTNPFEDSDDKSFYFSGGIKNKEDLTIPKGVENPKRNKNLSGVVNIGNVAMINMNLFQLA